MGTCSNLAVGIFSAADPSTPNDRQLALSQAVHVSQGSCGQVQKGFATQTTNLQSSGAVLMSLN